MEEAWERTIIQHGFIVSETRVRYKGRTGIVSETFRKRAHAIHCPGYTASSILVGRTRLPSAHISIEVFGSGTSLQLN